MKFGVKVWSGGGGGGGARPGLLQLGSCSTPIDIPSLLLSTRKGLPFFLSPDLLSSLPLPHSRLLHVCPLHFFEWLSTKTISKIGGLHKMLGLPEYEYIASLRDSIHCLPDPSAANKFGASFDTPYGRFLVTPAEYMDMISSMRPNVWASIADEVPITVSAKRNKTSVDRTVRWLDECIALNRECGAVLGSIVGGTSVEERQRCAQEVATRNMSGYWIGGFGLGESSKERFALLNAVTDCLPKEKPRLISGLETPEEILQGVAAGIDLFNSAYVAQSQRIISVASSALTGKKVQQSLSDTEMDRTKIDLRGTIYRKDTRPIVENCRCHTCQNHTKAYIHHLLNVKQMLAEILLEIHNTHHYLGFFGSIREAIRDGRFEQFQRKFLQDTQTVS